MLRGKLTEQMKVQLLGGGKKAPFPYESPDFTDAIKHSVWYMADVAACYAMRDMLEAHPYFTGFEIHRRRRQQGRARRGRQAAGREGDQGRAATRSTGPAPSRCRAAS